MTAVLGASAGYAATAWGWGGTALVIVVGVGIFLPLMWWMERGRHAAAAQETWAILCEASLRARERGGLVCTQCLADVPAADVGVCPGCGEPFEVGKALETWEAVDRGLATEAPEVGYLGGNQKPGV